MNTIQSELKRIQKFLQTRIAEEKYKMARPPLEGEDDGSVSLVRPKVLIGNIPHANFSMYGATDLRFYQAPYFLVGYEKASYRADDEDAGILIQACAYTAMPYENDDGDEESLDFPDNMGVLDVTGMLEKAMEWLQGGGSPVPSGLDYEIGNYGTQAYTYPYNFGYLAFRIMSTVGQSPHRKMLAEF